MAAITSAEIVFKRSVAAAAGNTTAQADPNASLGDQVSTTVTPDATANAVFDDITGAENAASTVDYRCQFVDNTNTLNTLVGPKLFIASEVAGGASISIGVDPTATSARGAATQQAVIIANETTAPAGVTFSAPTTLATGLALSDIPAGSVKAFWLRRTAANTAALTGDGVTWTVGGDTGSA